MVSQTIIRQLQDIVGQGPLSHRRRKTSWSIPTMSSAEKQTGCGRFAGEQGRSFPGTEVGQPGEDPGDPQGVGVGIERFVCAPEGGIVMAMSKMNKILEINPEDRLAVVEPGVITNDLQMAVEAQGASIPRTRRARPSARSAGMWPRMRAVPGA